MSLPAWFLFLQRVTPHAGKAQSREMLSLSSDALKLHPCFLLALELWVQPCLSELRPLLCGTETE